jgi:hypothetical protein
MFGRGGGESYEGHFVLALVVAVWPKSEFRGRDHTHIPVRTTVIEEPAFRLANESLDENDMGDLPNFVPLGAPGRTPVARHAPALLVASLLSNNAQPVR